MKKTGENNLKKLIQNMDAKIHNTEFVFCTVPHNRIKEIKLDAICEFNEAEGVTLIVAKNKAKEKGLSYQFACKMITLKIHSDLNAIGFLAAVTDAFAEKNIPVNAVSAYFHDHLFVPTDKAEEAMLVLSELENAKD